MISQREEIIIGQGEGNVLHIQEEMRRASTHNFKHKMENPSFSHP